MEILFVTGKSVVSDLILTVTKEPVSHCALMVDGKWVVHSNLRGIHVEYLPVFLKTYSIVYSISTKTDDNKLYKILERRQHSWYDVGGLLFAGLNLWARRYCPRFVSKQNLWQISGMYMCTEWVSEITEDAVDSLITPYQLYLRLTNGQISPS